MSEEYRIYEVPTLFETFCINAQCSISSEFIEQFNFDTSSQFHSIN